MSGVRGGGELKFGKGGVRLGTQAQSVRSDVTSPKWKAPHWAGLNCLRGSITLLYECQPRIAGPFGGLARRGWNPPS